MTWTIDPYLLHILLLSPLVAAIFITLIPSIDLNSKRAISRFFAVIGFIIFIRIYYLFTTDPLSTIKTIKISFSYFNLNFTLMLTIQNLFLYGAASATLLANTYMFESTNIRNNTQQVTPFVLIFIFFISAGQESINTSLPILSVANFIAYYLIGHSDKIRRGSTIFQMGIFILSCDALALLLLQYQTVKTTEPPLLQIYQIALIAPGLSRMCLPIFAPFMKRLFLNVDDTEGPFLINFLQISGFSILILVRESVGEISKELSIIIGIIALFSAINIALLSVSNNDKKVLPYYCLVFYSSVATAILFLSPQTYLLHISLAIMLTNLAIFFLTSKLSLIMDRYRYHARFKAKINATWFISLCLFIGIPGLGIGSTLWPGLYLIGKNEFVLTSNEFQLPWSIVFIFWSLASLILSYALLDNLDRDFLAKDKVTLSQTVNIFPMKKIFLLSPFLILLISWLIPLATYFAVLRN